MCEDHTNVAERFSNISEDFRSLLKTFEEVSKMFRSYTNIFKYKLRDKLNTSEIIDINTPPESRMSFHKKFTSGAQVVYFPLASETLVSI